MTKEPYGMEVVLDLHGCDTSTFNRKSIRQYLKELCIAIDMKRDKLVWWDDLHTPPKYRQTEAHTKGTSAVQFILTSSIVIHTLDIPGDIYINIFSCKEFDAKVASDFTKNWFKGKIIKKHVFDRI